MTISFVIPVKNDAARLDWCLTSIRRNQPAGVDIEIVVADNGSTDESPAVAARHDAVVLVLPQARLGELRNRAAAAARGTHLAFVDADHEIVPMWVASALETFAATGGAAVGAACWPPADANWVQQCFDRLRDHAPGVHPVEWLGSGNMAVERMAFDAVGGFDTSLETCEDVDLCRRLRLRGYELYADARMRNVHFGDPRSLRQILRGEMWRGRDNIRVSLRPPRSLRALASAGVSAVVLSTPVLGLAGLVIGGTAGRLLALTALALAAVAIGGRTLRMVTNGLTLAEMPGGVLVASAYETGRAVALIARAGYGRRRRSAA